MPVTEETARGYDLPNAGNKLIDDVERIRSALYSVDGDVTSLLTQLGLRAALNHGHTIDQITGLQTALDSKLNASSLNLTLGGLSNVSDAAAANNQVLMWVSTQWVPVSLQQNHIQGLETAFTNVNTAIAAKMDAASLAAATAKTAPADTDTINLIEVTTNVLRKITWANVKTVLMSLFVQQGTGVGQSTNTIKIGHSADGPRVTVDTTDFGPITFGKKTVGTGAPTGGNNGDFHLQV